MSLVVFMALTLFSKCSPQLGPHNAQNAIRPELTCDLGGKIWSMAQSEEHDLLAVGAHIDGQDLIKISSARKLEFSAFGKASGTISSLSFSKDGALLLSASFDGMVRIWDVKKKKLLGELKMPAVRAEFFKDLIAAGAPGGSPDIFEFKEGRFAKQKVNFGGYCSHWTFSGDGTLFASSFGFLSQWKTEKPGQLKVWNTKKSELTGNYLGEADEVYSIDFSDDGKFLATGGVGKIAVWDLERKKRAVSIETATKEILAIRFVTGDSGLVSGSSNGQLVLWNLRKSDDSIDLNFHTGPIRGLVYFKASATLISCEESGRIAAWALTGK